MRGSIPSDAGSTVTEVLSIPLIGALDRYFARHPEELEAIGLSAMFGSEETPMLPLAKREALWSAILGRLRVEAGAPSLESLVDRTLSAIREGLSEVALGFGLGSKVGQVRKFVRALDGWIGELSSCVGLEGTQASLVRDAALPGSFAVLALSLSGREDLAARSLVEKWRSAAAGLGIDLPAFSEDGEEPVPLSSSRLTAEIRQQQGRMLFRFQAAVFQLLRGEEALREGLDALTDLQVALELDGGQAGRLLGVDAETVGRWEAGNEAIPQEAVATLIEAQESLQRLRGLFMPERLPLVIRRPAELFEGETALDWILAGRLRDVADRYELLLRYQA